MGERGSQLSIIPLITIYFVQIASNCTSFMLHDEFLLLTTHSHTLRCVYLSSLHSGKFPKKQKYVESKQWLKDFRNLLKIITKEVRTVV